MYQDFVVTTIDTNIKNKTITISASFDIDADSVNDETFQLYEKSSRNFIEIDFEVIDKRIIATLLQWPEPNVEYVLRIQKLKSILDDELVSGIRRKVIFESSIVSELKITYPAENEVINDLKAEWEEIVREEVHGSINSYYLEISTDNAFYNIIKKLDVVDRTNIDLSELQDGQYYVRGRVQKELEYSMWSDTITFVIGEVPSKPGSVFEEDEPIYIPEMMILSQPQNGETPKSLLLEFDCDIDPESIKNILIIRRTI
jgi:hypothetical protein